MKTTRVSSTDLKLNTAEILNMVAYGGHEMVVERYGEELVRISPIVKKTKRKDYKKIIDKYFGALPDFPDVTKDRYFRERQISL